MVYFDLIGETRSLLFLHCAPADWVDGLLDEVSVPSVPSVQDCSSESPHAGV